MELVRESGGYHVIYTTHAPLPIPSRSFQPTNKIISSSSLNLPKAISTQTDDRPAKKSISVASSNGSIRSSSACGNISMSRNHKSVLPHYDPINDPHLRDYFERKFSLSSAKRHKPPPKMGPNDVLYKVRVKTGNMRYSSTTANVYLSMVGKKGHIRRQHLFKKAGAVCIDKIYRYKFDRGSTNLFRIIGNDIGNLAFIFIEHDGKDVASSWFLDEVIITNTKTHKSWIFECHDWLSLYTGIFRTQAQLFPTRVKEKYTETEYEIIVVTGDKKFAGTDANVSVVLFGNKNRASAKQALSNHGKKDFERGQTDIFKIHSNYVGPLSKIRIEHDNTGKHPGWFLDRVVITDLKEPKVKYFFPCGIWFSRDEGDGLISRELRAHIDPLGIRKNKQYKISVYTGDVKNAGTDADVSIVLYGTLGDSGEFKLDDKKNNFEKGQMDQFVIECPSVGELEKIRIGHNNKGVAAGWFLNKVIIDDLESHKVYEFVCNRWLAVDEDDGQTYVTVVAGDGHQAHDAKPGVPYKITVKTGNVKYANTSAKVYIELFEIIHKKKHKEEEHSSGRIYLKDGNYKPGRTDLFEIEVDKMMSPLSYLIVGHDNTGLGPGWFLEHIDVECPTIGMKQVFPCNKWLAKDEDDHKIERILYEDTSLRIVKEPKVPWYFWIYTSDIANSGTDAHVIMVMYGDKGKTDEIELKSKKDLFERGKCDELKIELDDVGQPFKVRVQHDNSGMAPGWHLDRIEGENMITKEKFIFPCKRWLATDEDDHEIIRELPAEGKHFKPLPLVKYEVEVMTGDMRGAGTDANVFINVFGDNGDTGERPLERPISKFKNKFERNQLDVFLIEAVKLKSIHKIIIGHDGKNPSAGWFLDKVTVKQVGNTKYDQPFECKRWLATDEDDGKIVRELVANQSQYLDKMSYNVSVKTGDKTNAGTDANVHIKIFGSKGDTGNIKLKNSDNTINKFERGRVDLFNIEHEDIGKIKKLKIGHDGKGLGSGWFLDYVQIDIPSKGIRYLFNTHRWLDKNEEDGLTEIELTPTDEKTIRKLIPYVVTVRTGDKSGAGTDADVFVQLYGPDGKSEEIFLKNRTDNFERGKEDIFKIEAEDIGPLFKIRLGHNNKGMNAGWFCKDILIQRHALKGSKRMKTGSRASSLNRSDTPDIEEYHFRPNCWFARDEGDKQIVRELIALDSDGRPLFDVEEISYIVKVYTGDKSNAGTDANVLLTIYGKNADSGERKLKESDRKNKFERKQIDTFEIKAIDLGELQKVKIRHDNSGPGPAWYLDKIEILNPKTNRGYLFNCEKWLATDEDDGKISRELPALDLAQAKHVKFRDGVKNLKDQIGLETEDTTEASKITLYDEDDFIEETMEPLTYTYNVSVTTSDKRGAGTDANCFIQLFGEHNDSGKQKLETSKTNKNKFERAQTDVFEIKEADIGDLRKIKIGHDGKGVGSGWHVEKVVIDAPKLGKKWVFPCGRWLDTGEADGKLEVELEPIVTNTEEYEKFVNYEVAVFTSNIRGADTSANPYIQIYGRDSITSQVNLCKNKVERHGKFQKGATDRFILELEDVGEEIKKVRIGHDDKGMGSGWHVDKVEVRRLKKSGKGSTIYVFPCNRWLARDEDDKAIERDLVAKKIVDEKLKNGEMKTKEIEVEDALEMKKYTVDVYTGDKFMGGTNANVFLTMYGDKGDSGEKKLVKSQHMDKFERNQMDSFEIETADLGRLYRVKIRHDDSGISADWFLDRVEIRDHKRNYIFLCERWLSTGKEDKRIERSLYEKNYTGPRADSQSSLTLKSSIGGSQVIPGSRSESVRSGSSRTKSPLGGISEAPEGPVMLYTIVLKTGDEKNAGTSAQVFIRIIGENPKMHTGRIGLQLAKKKKFEPGSSETFTIEALDVGEIGQVEVGHDGIPPGSGWLLKEIEIDTPIKGRSYFITCNSWLSTEKGDGKIIRKFDINDATTKISTYKNLIPYLLTIFTGDVPKAGTDCNVTVKAFGSKGASHEIGIDKMDDRFERSAIDSLRVELEDIGSLKKVRVSHNNKGSRKDWFLDRVEMTNLETQKLYVFDCQKWLSKKTEISDGISIDIALLKGGKETIHKTSYKISVKTSDISGAGTNANVFVMIFGENGDSGQLELKNSSTHFDKFEKNELDVFTFENILSLGELTKLRIWHDDSGALFVGASWHLENVIVEDLNTRKEYKFPCNKWLSKSKDDKQLTRELTCINTGEIGTPKIGERTEYEITMVTSDKRDAGTTQNVMIALIGEKKSTTKEFVVENSSKTKILRRGQTDTFVFKTKSVGKLKSIALAHIEKEEAPLRSREGKDASWHCQEVAVKDLATDTTYIFPVLAWLDIDDRPQVFDLGEKSETAISKTRTLENFKYEISVVTGNEKGAGTDANVSIILYGENGDTGLRPLKQSLRNLFEKGQTDKFIIECLDLGELQKLHVEHDNSSFIKSAWYLEKIEVLNMTTNHQVVFPCNKWLAKNKDDNEIARDLYPIDPSNSGRGSRQSVRSRESQSGDNTKSPKHKY